MSILIGTDSTSFWSDLKSLAQNALTGQLSEDQKQDIARNATLDLTECQVDINTPTCQELLAGNRQTVEAVAPNETCAIRLPVYGCVQSWENLLSGAVVIGVALVLLYLIVVFNPRRLLNG